METINTEKIKQLLEQKGEKQLFFAKAIGLQPGVVSAAFHGKRELPMRKILKIASYFNVSPFEIVCKNDTAQHQHKSTTNKNKDVA